MSRRGSKLGVDVLKRLDGNGRVKPLELVNNLFDGIDDGPLQMWQRKKGKKGRKRKEKIKE